MEITLSFKNDTDLGTNIGTSVSVQMTDIPYDSFKDVCKQLPLTMARTFAELACNIGTDAKFRENIKIGMIEDWLKTT